MREPKKKREREIENRIGSGASIILARRRRRNTFVVLFAPLCPPRPCPARCVVWAIIAAPFLSTAGCACVDDDDDDDDDDFAVATERPNDGNGTIESIDGGAEG